MSFTLFFCYWVACHIVWAIAGLLIRMVVKLARHP
jgi:hypothetical protein